MNEYICSVDIAKRRDFTAVIIAKRVPEIVESATHSGGPTRVVNYLDIVAIDKFNGLTYPQMVEVIASRMGHQALVNNADLIVDGTGVGEAAVDLLRLAGLAPLPILFTGGEDVHRIYNELGTTWSGPANRLQGISTLREIRVPKVDLKDAGQLLVDQGRVRADRRLRWAQDLETQMLSFRGKVNEKTGHVKWENDTDETHDDLLVAYLMAAWWFLEGSEGEKDATIDPERYRYGKETRDWSPFDYM